MRRHRHGNRSSAPNLEGNTVMMPPFDYRLPIAALASAFLLTGCGAGSAGSASAASNALGQISPDQTTASTVSGPSTPDPMTTGTVYGSSAPDPTTTGTGSGPGVPAPGTNNPTEPVDPPLPPPTQAWTPGKPGRFLYVANSNLLNVSAYAIDASSGAITEIPGSPFPSRAPDMGAACEVVSTGGKFLYCANNFSVSVFSIDTTTGAVAEIAGSPFDNALIPNGITLNAAGTVAYEPNIVQGNVSGFRVDAATGALTDLLGPGSGSRFPAGTHPIYVALTPNGAFAYCVNNGVNDEGGDISAYRIDPATGALQTIDGPPSAAGARPKSMTIDPAGRFAYVANSSSNTISGYAIEASTGRLTAINGSPFATGSTPEFSAMHPSGRFFYVSNFVSNSSGSSGSGSIGGYAVDPATGALTELAGSPFAAGNGPTAVVIEGSGRFLYTSNFFSATVSVYSVDATTGALTQVQGSPFALTDNTRFLAIAE
jgi:6-phosphogluconolactonase